MKKTNYRKGLILLLFVLLVSGVLISHQNSTAKSEIPLQQFNEYIISLPSNDPLSFDDNVFSCLDPFLARARIIGLGEATHGTKQVFQMKQRLFKYLVEHHNCKALGFEYDFRFKNSLKIENYITNGEGNLKEIMDSLYWTHRNKEFFDLITWMRQYNSGKEQKDMIHFIGIDSQLDIWYGKELDQYISQFDKQLHESVAELLNKLTAWGTIKSKKLSREKYLQVKDILTRLKEKTTLYLEAHPKLGQSYDRELLLHVIDSYLLSHEERYGISKKEYIRDRHMAEHSLWLLDFAGPNVKIAIWAHNSHIAKISKYTPDGRSSMGKYIGDKLGTGYLAIGTSFSIGSFAAVTEDCFGKDTNPIIWKLKDSPPEGTVNYLFNKAKYKNFIFPIVTLSKSNRVNRYLDKEMGLFGVGDYFTREAKDHYTQDRMLNLVQSFDVIFNLYKTEAISILPQKK